MVFDLCSKEFYLERAWGFVRFGVCDPVWRVGGVEQISEMA